MNRILLFISLCLFWLPVLAQKPPIDYSTPDNWPQVNPRLISNDGKYVCYTMGTARSGPDLIIQATGSAWKKVTGRAGSPLFTADSRFFLYSKGGDSLGLIKLSDDSAYLIADVGSFKIPKTGGGRWLAYQRTGPDRELVLRDLATGQKTRFPHVVDFLFSSAGKVLLVKTSPSPGNVGSTSLIWYNTLSGLGDTIYRGGNAINFAFDNDERRLAFLNEETDGNGKSYSLWHYQSGWPTARLLCDRSSPGMKGAEISPAQSIGMSDLYSPYNLLPIPSFGNNDSTIFFGIRRPLPKRQRDSVDVGANVTIWDMRSAFPLTSAGIRKEDDDRSFPAAICFDRDKGANTNLLQQVKDAPTFYMPNESAARFIVTRQPAEGPTRRKVAAVNRYNIYLTSVIDGARQLIARDLLDPYITVSLTGKYIIWYDWDKRAYFSYNTATSVARNITGKIPVPLTESSDNSVFPSLAGIEGWLERDTALLINDSYNIWKVDPAGRQMPVNLTALLAHRRRIIFRYLRLGNDLVPVSLNDSLIVTAFDVMTKCSAILQIGLHRPDSSRMPKLDKKICFFPTRYLITLSGLTHPFVPKKAGDAKAYLVEQMDATEFPNLYTTSDFRSFKPITSLSPQKKYNWYTVELTHWRMLDGSIGEGLLYKPEDFDSSHHYPLLIYCYERFTDALHIFLEPVLSQGVINIPFFTSNGYVVFVPDISYRPGHVGESAYNAAVSAAAYLVKKHWIDASKIGLQGHSFGGFETNYIVTRSHLFAAACSGSGTTDAVSLYGGTWGAYGTEHHFFETGQFRMGASLWDRPDLYIENSPVFRLDNVTTPLLIMHNKGDERVSWSQAVELYTGLQRLGKKAWLLEYDGEGHSLIKRNDQLDFTIRMRQFFDHYLMNAPAPDWMNEDKAVK